MIRVFLAAALLLGLGVLGMCVSIIVRKDGHFPHYDVGSNEEMRRMGIRCYKDEDAEIRGRVCRGGKSEACKECNLYGK